MYHSILLRIQPNQRQREALEHILADSCEAYNAALEERRDAWKQRKSISYEDQTAELTELRQDPQFARVAVDIQREALRRVDRAFQAFFRRSKAGEKPGFPRFRSRFRYDSFAYHAPRVRSQHIRIPKVGDFRFKSSQDVIGKPKAALVKRQGKKWVIRLTCDIGTALARCAVSKPVGIDVGLRQFVTLSDGTAVENPRWLRKQEARIAAANRCLARKQKHSKNRISAKEQLRRAHQRAADARRNFVHHVSKLLISNYDMVAFEKLNIRAMARSNLAKSILDAAWGELIWQITYKAEYAGKWAVPVNPKGTSIRCSQCGADVPKTLADRQHSCAFGASLDRDHNAALNILALGVSAAGIKPSKNIPFARGILTPIIE